MTDGGALPIAFSRTVASLRDAGWLAGTVTVGPGLRRRPRGGHPALRPARGQARRCGADVAVVIQGPGNVGTGTPWGYTGVAAGEALNAAGTLGGRGVAALRVSDADPRERHRGISHHSPTAYGRVALVPPTCRCPASTGEFGALVARAGARTWRGATGGRLTFVEVAVDGLDAALRGSGARCRPWAAGSTRTTRLSSRRRSRAVCRPAAGER